MQGLPALRLIQSLWAGVDKLLVPDLAPQVVVSRMVDPGQALGIAQYVAAMVLRHVRGQPRYDAQQLARDWTRHPMGAVRSRVLVLGWGAIGREIGPELAYLRVRETLRAAAMTPTPASASKEATRARRVTGSPRNSAAR